MAGRGRGLHSHTPCGREPPEQHGDEEDDRCEAETADDMRNICHALILMVRIATRSIAPAEASDI